MKAVALVLLLCACPSLSRAEPRPTHWLRQHGSLEWVVAAASFRSSLGVTATSPGFDTFAGGGELGAGLDFGGGGLGIVASGRVLAGGQAGGHYLEGLATLGLLIRVSETVRLRVGPAAGQAQLADERATLVGGFVAGTIDLFALGTGRLSTALAVRIDVDAMLGGVRLLPDRSMAFAAGVGLRY